MFTLVLAKHIYMIIINMFLSTISKVCESMQRLSLTCHVNFISAADVVQIR